MPAIIVGFVFGGVVGIITAYAALWFLSVAMDRDETTYGEPL
jgi:hypothetical protein